MTSMSDAKHKTPATKETARPTLITTSPTNTSPTTGDASSSSPMPTPTPKSPTLKSPLMLAKLATLSKPGTLFGGPSSSLAARTARHSIDVRTLPSYLDKKRQSTFGQFLSVLSPSSPNASESPDEPLFKEPIAPTISLGERVAWVRTTGPEFGSVKWIGRMPQVTNDWTVGIEFDNCIGSGDGTLDGRRYFISKENFAKFLPLSALTKVDNYSGRPRSGTMLSRMSVQLKPGQLISIQRTPSVQVEHCSLNAPHHVGHDVHFRNANHCLCASCNHPCAHICKTKGPKARKNQMAHMCHFSSKPHNKLCCGGEDLPYATKPLTHMGMSWMHNEAIASYRTVQTPYVYSDTGDSRRKSLATSHDESKAQSHLDDKPSASPQTSTLKDRADSVLSISSLPSSGSPAQVFIARGVLTDESDLDDSDRSVSPDTRMGRLRSLVACFSVKPHSLKKRKDRERRKKVLKKHKPSKTADFDERRIESNGRSADGHPIRAGLSTDTSVDGDPPQSSHNQTSSLTSSIQTSKSSANGGSPAARKPPNSPENSRSPNVSDGSAGDQSKSGRNFDRISEETECPNGCLNSSSNSSGHLITTKAEIESIATQRSPSSRSTTSVSDSLSPYRHKKGPAPTPPPPTLSPTVSSASLPQTPINTSSQSLAGAKKRASYKKNAAPPPPNYSLTRSLSEQKQLNMKNMINAVPSFRSEVDLNRVSRSSADRLVDASNDSGGDPDLVCDSGAQRKIAHNDAATQFEELDDGYYEDICQFLDDVKRCANNNNNNSRTDHSNEKPELPKKTFDPISRFGCEISASPGYECNKLVMSRSVSMPFADKSNHDIYANQAVIDGHTSSSYSRDLNALLSPKRTVGVGGGCARNERLVKGLSQASVTSNSTVIEFINALTDLEDEMNLADQDSAAADNDQEVEAKSRSPPSSVSETSDEKVTVKSKWRYSSSSLESLSSSLRNSVINDNSAGQLLPAKRAAKQANRRRADDSLERPTTSLSDHSISSLSSSTLSAASTIRSSSSTPVSFNHPSAGEPKPAQNGGEHSPVRAGRAPKQATANSISERSPINSLPLSGSGSRDAPKSPAPAVERVEYLSSLSMNNSLRDSSSPAMLNSGQLVESRPKKSDRNRIAERADGEQIDRLMQQLEVAIAYGQHRKAAVLARELAIRKVTCVLNRPAVPNSNLTPPIITYLYIENKLSHRGPIPFQVYPSMSLKMLKMKVEKEFDIPADIQRWILGKTLATNPNASLATYGITCSGSPIFLYLLTDDEYFANLAAIDGTKALVVHTDPSAVALELTPDGIVGDPFVANSLPVVVAERQTACELCEQALEREKGSVERDKPRTYFELVELDDGDCVANSEPFECPVCFGGIDIGDGVVLRDCLHSFCRNCLQNAVQYTDEADVKCPFRNDEYACDSRLQDREVKAIVPIELYERYLQRSVSTAESKIEKSFHCRTADCVGWCEFDDNVNLFRCPVCARENCLTCQAIHEGRDCRQYQEELQFEADQNPDAKMTKDYLNNMLLNGEALRCPQCQIVLMKKWGCDWLRCSMCETEICWVTKGPRWGSKGKGDTSGGCKCMLNGKRCHPNCKYCH